MIAAESVCRLRRVLLERDQELGLLTGLLAELETSGGKVVLLRGEAGIGKSSLVREFIERNAQEAHVVIGSCDDLLIPQALGPFWDVARDEPSLAEPLRNGDRPGVLEATLDLLSGSLRPNVLVIEDTHWADEGTLDAVKYLGRRISKTNGLLLLTYRDGDVDYDHPLRSVIGDLPPESVVRIQLGGLSEAAVSALLEDSGFDPHDVFETTGGNPFLVTELAAAGDDRVPSSVQDSVMARVRKLSPGAIEMMKVLSVIPEHIARSEMAQVVDGTENLLVECEQRGLLESRGEFVAFRHELIRRAVEASLTESERIAANRRILDGLPGDSDPARVLHHARAANNVDLLIEFAPVAARAAAHVGSHREAVDHWRQIALHFARVRAEEKGLILEEWSHEEFLMDNLTEAIELNGQAIRHYREAGDRSSESRVIAQAVHYYENDGQRETADALAQRAVDVLGEHPDGADLARALEAQAYLHMMSGRSASGEIPDVVDQVLAAGGDRVSERIRIRSLNHKGISVAIASYPDGRAELDEAASRAASAGQWYEESRALLNYAWVATEYRDLSLALDYAERAIASAVNHEIVGLEMYSRALYARALELTGEWAKAEDLARDQLQGSPITRMVVLPIVAAIESRSGREAARKNLREMWTLAVRSDEFQRMAPAAIAVAEHGWVSGIVDISFDELRSVIDAGLHIGFKWSPGLLALWLWKLGAIDEAPRGIADPYRLLIEGDARGAAELLAAVGCPYERAIALTHGGVAAQLEAIDILDGLGASAVAAKLRRELRDRGVSVPRGKAMATRRNVAGLTSRQAEVLLLLAEELSNADIADRLFLSPRTVEHHVAAVLSKLDVSSREEAVSAALRQGLLPTT
jgi:DNA-binding CsgD family transcriptional regulator